MAMAMARCPTSFVLFFLAVIVGKSIETKADSCDFLDRIGGGCPDLKACGDTCQPCYRGVGVVQFSCVAPGGGILFWRCRCEFKNGAPCPPIGPPTCPAPSPLSHRKIGGDDQPDVKYYYNHEKNVTDNIVSPVLQFP